MNDDLVFDTGANPGNSSQAFLDRGAKVTLDTLIREYGYHLYVN